jgi:hypothetical protein
MNIIEIRQRALRRMHDHVDTTPQGWDRDCRCCMELLRHRSVTTQQAGNLFDLYRERTGRKDYHIRGGQLVIQAEGEPIHADHIDSEITLFLVEEASR